MCLKRRARSSRFGCRLSAPPSSRTTSAEYRVRVPMNTPSRRSPSSRLPLPASTNTGQSSSPGLILSRCQNRPSPEVLFWKWRRWTRMKEKTEESFIRSNSMTRVRPLDTKPCLFSFIFGLFQPNKTIFTTNQSGKNSCPSFIRRWDLNPWPCIFFFNWWSVWPCKINNYENDSNFEPQNLQIIVSGAQTYSDWFEIDKTTGLITTQSYLDCELESSPKVIVVATDQVPKS